VPKATLTLSPAASTLPVGTAVNLNVIAKRPDGRVPGAGPAFYSGLSRIETAGVIVVPSARRPPMRTQSTDTPPEIEEILLEGYRRMPPVEKLRQVFDLNRTAQRMAALRIQARYGPNLSERELRLRLVALWLDRETMVEAFGWDPEVEGY
jgi:hypothetical protein